MIHVSSGHEKGIGLEVFIKACSLLNNANIELIKLHTSRDFLEKYFKDYNYQYEIAGSNLYINRIKIRCEWIKERSSSASTNSLKSAISSIKNKYDILFTLPTSKNQLFYNNKICKGYTEFLRKYFKNNDLTMIFKNKNRIFVLLSDHISLREVPSFLTKKTISKKINNTLENIETYFFKPNQIYLAGINPHAGENGLLGSEERIFDNILKENNIIRGPLPGDTLHYYFNKEKQVFIFPYHDQALGIFKLMYGTMGSNITLGLEFIRMSVDHGTAFHLYGSDTADCIGCYHVLREAIKLTSQYTGKS